jgi:thiol:disulfide interchange protein DsbA
MRKLFAVLILCVIAPLGCADDNAFVEGKDYVALSKPVPTETGEKVEVLELFWYGCPHCFRFEPYLAQWKKEGMPDYVELVQKSSVLNPSWATLARADFAAELLGVRDEIHQDLFNAIHLEHRPLNDINQLTAFFAEHGVDEIEFQDAYNSFAVETELRKAIRRDRAYKITGVPSVAINGKYVTGGRMAGNNTRMMQIIKYLAEKEHDAMKLRKAQDESKAEGQSAQ